MRKILAATACLAALVCASSARAQTSCVPQTRTQLLTAFADNVPPGSITPQTMRNLVCSVLNLNLNLVGQSLTLSGGVSPVLATPGLMVDGSGNTTVNTLQVSGSGSAAITSPGFTVNSSGAVTALSLTTSGTSALAAITGTTLVLTTTISAGGGGFLVDATGNVTGLTLVSTGSITGTSLIAPAITAATTSAVTIGNATNGTGLKVADAGATAVDFVQVTGGAAGSPGVVTIAGAGTDSAISVALTGKGTAPINFSTGGGKQVAISNTASAVDFVTLTGSAAGSPGIVGIGVSGTDTDISISLTPKGAGTIVAAGPIKLASSTTGAGTQTFTNSPCSGLTSERWIPYQITGQTGTWYIPACQ